MLCWNNESSGWWFFNRQSRFYTDSGGHLYCADLQYRCSSNYRKTLSYIDINLYFVLYSPQHQVTYSMGFSMLVLMGFKEALTGLILGFMLNFVFWGFHFPANRWEQTLVLVWLLYLTQHRILKTILSVKFWIWRLSWYFWSSMDTITLSAACPHLQNNPLGHYTINESVFNLLVKYSGSIFIIAVKIAAPVMVAFFLLHIATGVISRIIPQMQVFFVLQPVQIVVDYLCWLQYAYLHTCNKVSAGTIWK